LLSKPWQGKTSTTARLSTTLPSGRFSRVLYCFTTRLSTGFSLSNIAPSSQPCGRVVGTSFKLCTNISTIFSFNATSSSFVYSAFPPSRWSAWDWFLSPSVVINDVSNKRAGNTASRPSLTMFVWICASLDAREANTNGLDAFRFCYQGLPHLRYCIICFLFLISSAVCSRHVFNPLCCLLPFCPALNMFSRYTPPVSHWFLCISSCFRIPIVFRIIPAKQSKHI